MDLDRAKIIDKNFISCVEQQNFPCSTSSTTLQEAGLSADALLDLFDSQLISRHLDLLARRLKEQNQAFYTIGSSGHEGNAVMGLVFRHTDMAFLHYRSGAFVVQRMKKNPQIDPMYDLLLSLVASSNDPISSGRHKVFGSVPLFIPPQTSTIASHLPKAVGAALSITRAKELKIKARLPEDSVILCSFGDASVNHATAQTAFNAAEWIAYCAYPLPIIFICEDNGIGISVPTPNNWIPDRMQSRSTLHYLSADGLHLPSLYKTTKQAEYIARIERRPVFLHMKCVRLMGHAGSDIESSYLSSDQIKQTEFQDPLLHTARLLFEENILTSQQIIDQYKTVERTLSDKATQAIQEPKLTSATAVMSSIIPKLSGISLPPLPHDELRQQKMGDQTKQLKLKRNMAQQINLALKDILLRYENAVVFGEDVARKGGVYHVTADLMKMFGQRRVFDSLLDETTILGTAIGMAHNGFIPIPEIQFLAYLHNAIDQLRGEASTLSFFSNGQYCNPMVIRIPGLGYQKGFGGHFHNENSIAALRDIPGVIIACPSHGSDAAKMLRRCVAAAYQEGRVSIFLEPIALYMTKDLHETGDEVWLDHYSDPKEILNFDEIGIFGEGHECVIVTYANGYYFSRQAEKILREKHGISVKIIDLRWLAPLPEKTLLNAVRHCQRILIVDECRQTASLSEALMTLFLEKLEELPSIHRLTGCDSFIPLGQAWQYVLPSRDQIVEKVLEMMIVTFPSPFATQRERGQG